MTVPPDGYAWWYVDGISADGQRAVSVIAFIGSVFSPWYAWSGRRDPENHVCINVATYGPGGRFAMTERGRSALSRSETTFRVGPSALHWQDGRLTIDLDEWAGLPRPGRIRGRIVLTPAALTGVAADLTPDGAHRWRPFAPVAAISVDLDGPGGRWDGHGYFDANAGSRALEADFRSWHWGRFPVGDGAVCFYDAEDRAGNRLALGYRFGADGRAAPFAPPPRTGFARGLWGVARETRADPGHAPRQVLAMLDAPFYVRSVVRTRIEGEISEGVHESLDLRRFRSPLLKPMLALRVPRRTRWPAGA